MQHEFANQDRFWLSIFALYFGAHVALRSIMGGALGLDEAEILLQGQSLSWGYGPQLPLYAWLQWSMFQLTGATIFGLSLLKNAILFLTVLTIYGTLRTEYDSKASGLAALSLLLLPQISWEAQRDLTHSVLVNFSAALTFAVVWRLSKQRTPYLYIILGVVMACGALSKYNYGILLLSILAASLAMSETRRVLLSPWFLGSLLIGALLLWQPGHWIVSHPDIAFSNARKLGIAENAGRIISALKGLSSLALASLSFIAPLALIAIGLWLRYRQKRKKFEFLPLHQFMTYVIMAGLAITAIFILGSNSTNIKDRWLQPILIFAGPVVVLWLYPNLNRIGERRYLQISAVIAAIIIAMMVPYSMSGRSYRAAPFDEVAAKIKISIPEASSILASSWIAGNLVYADPDLRVIAIEGHEANMKADYLAWNADEAPRRNVDQAQMKIIEAPFKFDRRQTLRIAIARILD